MFLPFDKYQERVNSKYYCTKGERIYEDFRTFAYGGGRLACANAREFYEFSAGKTGEVRVCEFGVGDGSFAKAFLEELKRLDGERGTEIYGRTKYFLVDLSDRMIASAKKTLRGHGENVFFRQSDAASYEPERKFHCIRVNELLSDLPSKLIYRRGDETFELGFASQNLVSEGFRDAPGMLHDFPEGYLFPLNLGAISFLKRMPLLLEKGGYADIFDYGFAELTEARDEPREVWNDNVSRWYGEQVTVDVNFPHLKSVFPGMEVVGQKSYVEQVFGEKMFQVEFDGNLCYLTKKELGKEKEKLKKAGYSMESILGEFEEESDFHHARIRN